MKIVIDSGIPFIQGTFEKYFERVSYVTGNQIDSKILLDANALIVRTRTICNEELLHNSKLEIIASASVGTDHIDLEYCKKRNIRVFSAQGCNKGAVMQWVLAALGFITGKMQIPLDKKIIGIVGHGNIGSMVAVAAKALGMEPLVCDPIKAEEEGAHGYVSLATLAQNADFVTFHVPLTHSNRYPTFNMANEAFFKQLKPGAFIFNSARGGVVNEELLVEAWRHKRVGGIATDVWLGEPLILDMLMQASLVATPHVAGYSIEGKVNATRMAVETVSGHFGLNIAKWQPTPNPLSKVIELDISNLFNGDKYLLGRFMQHIYDIESETAHLKGNPNGFEQMRNAYSYRRENSGYLLHGCNANNRRTLTSLGFTCGANSQ